MNIHTIGPYNWHMNDALYVTIFSDASVHRRRTPSTYIVHAHTHTLHITHNPIYTRCAAVHLQYYVHIVRVYM